jgi:hypothetical protein
VSLLLFISHVHFFPIRLAQNTTVDGRSKPGDDAAFVDEIEKSLKMSSLDRATIIHHGLNVHRRIGASYLCSLTDLDGSVSDKSCSRVVASKVIGGASSEDLEVLVDRLALWIEAAVQHKENLALHLSDLIVDFVRDDLDRWTMLQVKGFRLFPESVGSIQRWLKAKDAEAENEAAVDMNRKSDPAAAEATAPAPAPAAAPVPKAVQLVQAREKLEEARGVQCKLCGLSFVDGQTVTVPTGYQGTGGPSGASANNAASKEPVAVGDKPTMTRHGSREKHLERAPSSAVHPAAASKEPIAVGDKPTMTRHGSSEKNLERAPSSAVHPTSTVAPQPPNTASSVAGATAEAPIYGYQVVQ